MRPSHLRLSRHLLLASIALAAPACKRPQITSSIVPKDIVEAAVEPALPPAPDESALGFSSPAGWTKLPADGRNAVRFTTGQDEQAAQIAVTPLPSMMGQEVSLVGLWRTQLGLPALSEEDAAKALQPAAIGSEQGQMFEVSGNPDGKEMRILTAFLHRGQKSWFFKIQGSIAVVGAQKAAFEEFLKSVQFRD